MFGLNKVEHALIAVYGDTEARDINQAISVHLPDKDIRVLAPTDPETLEQAAQNSVLVFIHISGPDDPNLKLGRALQNNRLVVADIVAFCTSEMAFSNMEIMAKGFDGCVKLKEAQLIEFKHFLKTKVIKGAQRLAGIIREEEFRRLSDALSLAPVSMIIFDADKRAVFVSDHYFRAYPKIAPRMVRGLRVYDAFEMMIEEEGIEPDDPRYDVIRHFWYNIDGTVEFTLDDGVTYMLKAIKLPSNRGTVLIGRNITEYKPHKRSKAPKKKQRNK